VIRDVPDFALMVGSPAKQIGWICYCGVTLPKVVRPTCKSCGRQYITSGSKCREVKFEQVSERVAA
jgi:UDP-2-acetamido-3-amino-2,3-dideoxy-glucuronate N-acetyltransferase